MPLSDEERAWAEKKIAAGAPKEQVFQFLASKRGMSVDLSGPGGIGPRPMINEPAIGREGNPVAQGAADIENMNKRYQQGLVRGIPAAAASLALTPVTGGMSLLPAMMTDFAGAAGADLLTQTAMKGIDPSRKINPLESAVVGAGSAIPGGIVRGALTAVQKFFGAAGGIPNRAINTVNQAAPLGGRKAYQMIKEAPSDAEMQIAQAAQKSVQRARSKSFPTAQAAVANYTQDVDTAPIYQRILSRLRTPVGNAKAVTDAEAAANKALDNLADTLPDKMTMTELEDYLQRIRTPVKDQIGQIGGSLKANDVKDISAFIRKYRDQLLSANPATAEGPAAFEASSQEMAAIKQFRKTILDTKGNLRVGVENIIRRLPRNRVVMGIVERYDAANGTTFAQQARTLGLKRQLTPTELKDAGSMLEALMGRFMRITGPPGRGVAKFITVAAPPRGYPSRGAAAYGAFKAAMEQEKQRTP